MDGVCLAFNLMTLVFLREVIRTAACTDTEDILRENVYVELERKHRRNQSHWLIGLRHPVSVVLKK